MTFNTTYLTKKAGARFKDVDTYKVSCDNPTESFTILKSLKAAEDVGSGINEFVHVLIANIKKNTTTNTTCVIKVHRADNLFVDREIKILQALQTYKNIVQYICHFECNNDIQIFMKPLGKHKPSLCNEKEDIKMKFIVMEYIHNGDIEPYLKSQNVHTLKSIILQSALIIIELGHLHNIYHGDINSGNILIKSTHKSKLTYDVFGKQYHVTTSGVRPVFIDFGRGGFYDTRSKNKRNIVDDILIMLMVFSNYISIDGMKDKIKHIVAAYERSSNIHKLLIDIETMFKR